ncbi:hypothetical protein FB567DRAFT_242265 [Paraphoma chrysanthemicola]|uniref:Uncharacterized protein n=1 Tax=Paraphoma chrysanthemicola TaxID=798071 RepID=A0A8K0W2Y0_9PLEO|nr:hypothetical protein FB567DRAFT_242265 [Paraphoma chrysanthemicola]
MWFSQSYTGSALPLVSGQVRIVDRHDRGSLIATPLRPARQEKSRPHRQSDCRHINHTYVFKVFDDGTSGILLYCCYRLIKFLVHQRSGHHAHFERLDGRVTGLHVDLHIIPLIYSFRTVEDTACLLCRRRPLLAFLAFYPQPLEASRLRFWRSITLEREDGDDHAVKSLTRCGVSLLECFAPASVKPSRDSKAICGSPRSCRSRRG